MKKQKYSVVIPKLYDAWERMISRCYDIKNQKYKYYGGIGVTVCDEWRYNYQNFLDLSLKNGWEEGLQIDKDTKGTGLLYSPETCCWITQKENQRARKHLVKVIYNGAERILIELCEEFGIGCRIVKQRMNRDGMNLHQALTTKNTGIGNFINRKRNNYK